ncbi:hypothetical protein HMPREF3039_02801 [Akkermansia sp. KLE1798]|nr:hypothetical protein HMPREF3039_02801 [Akkermansia sp. KLE1798]KZA03681.1 hypothetical protein HMPREF1326_02658 [Akkermansia sp. KLE1605]
MKRAVSLHLSVFPFSPEKGNLFPVNSAAIVEEKADGFRSIFGKSLWRKKMPRFVGLESWLACRLCTGKTGKRHGKWRLNKKQWSSRRRPSNLPRPGIRHIPLVVSFTGREPGAVQNTA